LPVIQNVEIYKLLADLVGIPADSPNLNATVMDQQFSLFGKFENVLKKPLNIPDVPNFGDVKFPLDESSYSPLVCGKQEISLGMPVYTDFTSDTPNCLDAAFEDVDKPFWWKSLTTIIVEKLLANDVDRIQARVSKIFKCFFFTEKCF